MPLNFGVIWLPMAKLSKKTELALWWSEYKTKITYLTVVVLTVVIIIAGFYPLSSEVVMGEVRAVSLSDNKTGTEPRATIYSPKTGEVVMVIPFGVILTVGDKVEISRGKTMLGIYRYLFIKKVSAYNKAPELVPESVVALRDHSFAGATQSLLKYD